jgi:hypothetical protein
MDVRRPGAGYPDSHSLPEAEEIWQRVAAYARDCLQNDRPVFTVTRSVENRITDVREGSIGRISAQGTTNASRVTRAMVESLWAELQGGEGGSSYLYFTKALVLAALPGIVEDMDGELVLRDDPAVLETKRRRTVMARDEGEGAAGGEGETHRRLKEFIYREPDVALASLKSGPYQRVAMEYVFPTGDRIDVVLIDGSGNVLLVEVKPFLSAGDLAPFAQAAKYRVLWSILRERLTSEIRCLVAAPDINASPWKEMKDKHAIECVAIRLVAANP